MFVDAVGPFQTLAAEIGEQLVAAAQLDVATGRVARVVRGRRHPGAGRRARVARRRRGARPRGRVPAASRGDVAERDLVLCASGLSVLRRADAAAQRRPSGAGDLDGKVAAGLARALTIRHTPCEARARQSAQADPAAPARVRWMSPREGHPRNQVDAPRNPTPPVPTTEHARNQVGTKSADAAAARGGQDLGRGPQGRGAKTARATFDAPRHPAQDRPPVSGAGHDPGNARAAVTSISAGVRRAPTRHRAGFGRSLSGDPFFDPAGPRALHRRGG